MNIQLIQHNLEEIKKQAECDDITNAVRTTMALAKLLLQEPIEADARSVYGAYGGMAVVLNNCFKTLRQNYDPGADLKALKEKIAEVNGKIADCAKDADALTSANSDLLKAEAALRAQKQDLENLRDKINEMIQIRDQELQKLNEEIAQKETALADLKKSCAQAKAERDKWLLVIDTDNRLIADLPDSVADKHVNALIKQAKEYQEQAKNYAELGEEHLRKVILALENVRKKMEGQG